jgi:hypothetical protein
VAIQVTLSRPATGLVKGTWSTTSLTASAPRDYKAVTGKAFTIAAKGRAATLVMTLRGDQITEGTRAFRVDLSNISGATAASTSGIVTILEEPSDS